MAYELTLAENERRFDTFIDGDLFGGVATGLSTPTIIAVGGQPGSWKSGLLVGRAFDQLDPAGTPVRIVGDELRAYHPQYAQLLADNDRAMAVHTALDANRWVERALDRSLERRSNVLLETTLRQPDVVATTMSRFAAAGFVVELWYLAVHPALSTLAIFQRYETAKAAVGGARWTPLDHHDLCVTMAPVSIAALADRVPNARLEVWTRESGRVLSVPSAESDLVQQIVRRVSAEHERDLTPMEAEQCDREVAALHASMLERSATAAELAELAAFRRFRST